MSSQSLDRNAGKPSWRVRRRIIISTLLFFAVTIGYGVWRENVELLGVLLPNFGPVATLIIAFYVLGAAGEDVLLRVLGK